MHSFAEYSTAVTRLKLEPDLQLIQLDIVDAGRAPYRHLTAELHTSGPKLLERLAEIGAIALELRAHLTMFTSGVEPGSGSIFLSVSRDLHPEETPVTKHVIL